MISILVSCKTIEMPKRKASNVSNLGNRAIPHAVSRPAESVPMGDQGAYLNGNELLATFQTTHECCKTYGKNILKLVDIQSERQGCVRAMKVICDH